MFSKGFVTQIVEPNAAGQPAILAQAIRLAAHLFEHQPVAFNAAAAALQLAIGLALLHPRSYRIALALSVTWGLAVWCFGEGLGGLLTATASPLTGAPGAAAVYVLVSLILWPADRAMRGSAASQGLLGDQGARVAWAGLWLLAAVLWLAPANLAPDAPSRAIAGAPAGVVWLDAITHHASRTLAGDGVSVVLALASVSALVALGVFADRLVRPMLAIGALLSLSYWVLGQGLGGIFTGQATDLNTGPLIVLLAATLYPLGPAGGSRRPHAPAPRVSHSRLRATRSQTATTTS
jgi:hypothetical protein